MSRYRPPTTPGSKYITPQGAQRLRDELDQLWLDERPRVTIAVSEAAAQGDRSENAEYTYGKKRLHEIDRRVRFLRQRLDGMTIVDTEPADPSPAPSPAAAGDDAAPSISGAPDAQQPDAAQPDAVRPSAARPDSMRNGKTQPGTARPNGPRRDPDRVYFGAWVQIEHVDGQLHWYRIVGPDEFDMASDYISMDSPLGRALFGKRLDDEVTVALPAGPTTVTIAAVHYGTRP